MSSFCTSEDTNDWLHPNGQLSELRLSFTMERSFEKYRSNLHGGVNMIDLNSRVHGLSEHTIHLE